MTGSLQTKKGKKGEVYYAVLAFPNKQYKWINLHLLVKNNKKLATEKLNELIAEYDCFTALPESILFIDYAKDWIKREENQVDTVTLNGYKQFLETHIIPYFEPLKLTINKIGVSHLEGYYDYKSKGGRLDGKEGGLSNRTVKLHSIVINLILKDAIYRGIIKTNPNERAKIPKNNEASFKGTFYTIEQLNRLLELMEGLPVHDMATITIFYGLRRSELMGLKWNAIDFENNLLLIQHTVVLSTTIVKKDKTKNKSSKRGYPLLPEVKEILLKLKAEQKRNKAKFGNCYTISGYVFTKEDGTPFHPSYVSHTIRKALKKADDLPMCRWHDLRHSTGTLLLAKGWSMKDVSEWLGHSNISTTMDIYTHVDINRKKELAKGLVNMLAV